MTKTQTNLIKIFILTLTAILFKNVISSCIVFYQSVSDIENAVSILLAFILGATIGLIGKCGLSLLFWYSYNTKYPNEKYNERILRKTIASFLFLSVISAVSWGVGMPLVFFICTLIVILEKHKKTEVAQ